MGYQPNFFAKYHNQSYQFILLTSDSTRLWTISDNHEDQQSLDQEFEQKYQIQILRLPTALDRRSKNNIWIKGLIKTIRKIDPDILYVHTLESFTSLRVLLNKSTLSNYKVFFDTHTLLNQFGTGLKSQLYRWLIRKLVSRRINRLGIKVFGTVPENLKILELDYGIQKSNILYSPIGTDFSIFKYDPDSRSRLREKLKLENNEIVLLYTGKLNSRKKPHLILEAINQIEKEIESPLHLFFLGPSDQDYIKQYFEFNFSNPNIRVKIFPAVPVIELYEWYSMADFAVFPGENTLSALDSQACRLPVIMESDPTNMERLKFGGVTYMKGNISDLSQKISEFISQPELLDKFAAGGEEYVRMKYDYRNIVRNMESDLGLSI